MKNFALVLALSLAACTTAFAAPNPTGKIDVSVGVASLAGGDNGVHNTVFIPGAINYGLNPNWAVGVSGGWADANVMGNNGLGSKVDAGSETLIPLFFDVIYRIHSEDNAFIPYFDLGLGAVLANHGGNRDLSVNNLGVRDSDGFGVKLAGGVDWFVTENWAYGLELGYVITDAKTELVSDVDNSKTDSIGLDFWYVGGNVKYRFD